MQNHRVLLVGGAGFVGASLYDWFRQRGVDVKVFDLCKPSNVNEADFFQGDVLDSATLSACMQGVTVCIHLASVGMSGRAMLDSRTFTCNVNGFKNTIAACVHNDVACCIYTSTYNVVFGGQVIENGNEQMEYFPKHKHTDMYSKSKAVAEQIALESNGLSTASGNRLRTAVIRPAGIYGEHEQRHLPRIASLMDMGLYTFNVGSPNARVDWVYIDNLVQAYALLVQKLLEGDDAVQGQVYCIADGEPINNFEFLRPLAGARRCEFPSLWIPVPIMIIVAGFLELLYKLFGIPPFLTRAEVFKSGVTHYFSIDKAQRELGYKPVINSTEGSKRIAEQYRRSFTYEKYFRFVHPAWFVAIALGMSLLGLYSFTDYGSVKAYPYDLLFIIRQFALLIFRSQQVLQLVWYAAWAAHILEGLYAVQLCKQLGCTMYLPWFIQTCLFGFASLSLLPSPPSDSRARKVD